MIRFRLAVAFGASAIVRSSERVKLSFDSGHASTPSCFTSTNAFLSVNSYGFVTFSTEADAIKAVSQLDKSELAGRQINVELAKPPTATAAGRIPKAAAKAAIQQGATEGEQVTEGQGEAKPKKSKSKKVCLLPALVAPSCADSPTINSALPRAAAPVPTPRLRRLATLPLPPRE